MVLRGRHLRHRASRSPTRTCGSLGIPTTSASSRQSNLQQTLILWVPLVLTGLAVGLRVPLRALQHRGPGQYLAGSIAAILSPTELPKAVDLPGVLLIVVTCSRAMLAGAVLAGIAGFLKGTVGAHEVITTIMLNWIVIWVGSYFFGLDGPFQTRPQEPLPSSEDIPDKAKLFALLGRPAAPGHPYRLLVALSGPPRLLTASQSHDARLRGSRRRAQPGGGALRRHQRGPELLPRHGDRGGLCRARRRTRRPRLGVPARYHPDPEPLDRVHRDRRRPARAEHRRRRRARRAPLRRAPDRDGDPQPRPGLLHAGARDQPRVIIQGLIVLFVGADLIVLLAAPRVQRTRSPGARKREPPPRHETCACGWVGAGVVSGSWQRSWRCPRSRSERPSLRSSSASSRSRSGSARGYPGRAPGRRVCDRGRCRRDSRSAYLATRSSIEHLEGAVVWGALLRGDAALCNAACCSRRWAASSRSAPASSTSASRE